ncbi:acetyl-CoA carboxylase biotin carboxyl carrier protein subunit [Lentzea sp. NBRC 105346]|uniref:acyl-CoA carboxylase subunit epsilon n=1 Tax=Lentzea sp. NBRC 105346 TaxID=3032205 RepID=UPI0024A19A7A|nr:acyl-CoA carboxylase subunit epsilon [Lentzea sp. NBRC 105346]GLZ35656.1 acetyl-CoA carboxylase biotin carboxyl carrier protein subunit [Lentzea sp. NBRC 105346]
MSGSERPLLRLVRGTPDDYELAALTAVVAGLASASVPEPEPERRSAWADRSRSMRRTLPHGPGAWRASGFPG